MSYDPAMRDGISEGGGPGAVDWGDVGGTLSDQTDLDTELAGKELVGVAATAVATHAGLADPHPGYLTPAEGNAAYDALGAATASTAAHAAAGDPHPQYLTAGELPVMFAQDAQDGEQGRPGIAGIGTQGQIGPALFFLADDPMEGERGPPGAAGAGGGAGGGGGSAVEVEVDFGSTPAWDALFTVTDATVSGASKIMIHESAKVATGRLAGDAQWDAIHCAALSAAGSFSVYALAIPGPVVGKRNLIYTVA